MHYLLTDSKLLHGDIKSFNVHIKGDFDICKLCYFGVSVPVDEEGFMNIKNFPRVKFTGTYLWSASEVFENNPMLINAKSEIFIYGLAIYECIALMPPHTNEMIEEGHNSSD